MKPRYRILEKEPGVYVVQRRGLLWGCNTIGHDYGDDEFRSISEAEMRAISHAAWADHVARVVKELP